MGHDRRGRDGAAAGTGPAGGGAGLAAPIIMMLNARVSDRDLRRHYRAPVYQAQSFDQPS